MSRLSSQIKWITHPIIVLSTWGSFWDWLPPLEGSCGVSKVSRRCSSFSISWLDFHPVTFDVKLGIIGVPWPWQTGTTWIWFSIPLRHGVYSRSFPCDCIPSLKLHRSSGSGGWKIKGGDHDVPLVVQQRQAPLLVAVKMAALSTMVRVSMMREAWDKTETGIPPHNGQGEHDEGGMR